MAQVRTTHHEEVGVNWVGLIIGLVIALTIFGGVMWWLMK